MKDDAMSQQAAEPTEETTDDAAAQEALADAVAQGDDGERQSEQADGEKALGDAGKKALDAMKADRNKARDDLRSLRDEFDAFKAKAEGKEKEHAAEQERRKVEADALEKANDRIKRAEVRAAAAGKLSDPADALKFIDLSEFEVSSDGEVDTSQIADAIDDLIRTKPYLQAQGGQRFQGAADGGARKEPAKPSQLSKSDLQGMTPEAINAARKEGRLDDLMGLTK